VLSVNTAQAAITSARAGLGVTSALSYQVAAAIRAGALVPLLTRYEPEPLPVHLVHPAGTTQTAKVRAFVALATPRLRALLAGTAPTKTKPAKPR
jgi:DNA-binding transcriptional LysR family regulator